MQKQIKIFILIFLMSSCMWLQPATTSIKSEARAYVGGVPMPTTFSIGTLKPRHIKMPTLAQINTAARNRKRAKMSKDDLKKLDEECYYAAEQADVCTDSVALEWDKKVHNLLEQGADPNYSSCVFITFHLALLSGKYKEILLFLNHGADIHKVGPYGTSALHSAVWRFGPPGKEKKDFVLFVAQILLKNGANPNILNEDGGTPLYKAICSDSEHLVKLLIDNRADPSIGRSDKLPLYHARTSGQVATLIRAGADYKNYIAPMAKIHTLYARFQ